ncbi:MAG: IS3 family transposase [Bacteroidota bacterium]
MKSIEEKRAMVDRLDSTLSISGQCRLLGLHRSGLYYKPRGENELNLELMRMMDEHYLDHPYKGAYRMYIWLTKDQGYEVSRNRIERLYYRVMGLKSLLPGPHTSKRCKDHAVYPYLLRGLEITYPNQVWATDITYIPMLKGYLYLTAFIDLFSRYVLNWSLSNTMDAQWCVDTLDEAIALHGKPEIINTDQGSQYTSELFTDFVVKEQKIKLSMDGKGRATDNAFIERLWRSVKYEHIYIRPHDNGTDLFHGLNFYFAYYNQKRRHQSINDEYPDNWYRNSMKKAA